MKKNLFYIVLLLILMPLGLFVQLELLPGRSPFLIASYGINLILAIIALFLLAWGIHHKKQNLATLYLITVALKLGVYFFYFHPRFEMDGVLTRSEFFIFFAPYAIGLLMEIVVLTRRYS
ncbi:MAG: hypothetical protein P8I42_01135 [Flavobacteriaceae bacterium]|nr:hypothetical protein [Flavobacteriaceae bacterium]MDG1911412.1 hypothetical protein [Flavobacteriaceae bacterium]